MPTMPAPGSACPYHDLLDDKDSKAELAAAAAEKNTSATAPTSMGSPAEQGMHRKRSNKRKGANNTSVVASQAQRNFVAQQHCCWAVAADSLYLTVAMIGSAEEYSLVQYTAVSSLQYR